jgi:predicted GTPase
MSAESDALKDQDVRLGVMEKKLDTIGSDIRELRVALVGEPNSDKASIMLRLDRLEQSEKLKSKIIWAIVGVGGPAILGLIFERLR